MQAEFSTKISAVYISFFPHTIFVLLFIAFSFSSAAGNKAGESA